MILGKMIPQSISPVFCIPPRSVSLVGRHLALPEHHFLLEHHFLRLHQVLMKVRRVKKIYMTMIKMNQAFMKMILIVKGNCSLMIINMPKKGIVSSLTMHVHLKLVYHTQLYPSLHCKVGLYHRSK